MSTLVRKTVDRVYTFLFPDAVGEFKTSFRYKLLIVLLVLVMFSSAAYTMVFIQS